MIRRMLALSLFACAVMAQSAQSSPISGTENLAASFVKITNGNTHYQFFYPAPPSQPFAPGDTNKSLTIASTGGIAANGFGLGTVASVSVLNTSSVAGWTITEVVAGKTLTFTATSLVSFMNPGPTANIDLKGTLSLTGYTSNKAEVDISLATPPGGDTSATISLVSSVPEPSAIALMGLGTVGVVGAGFFRRKRSA